MNAGGSPEGGRARVVVCGILCPVVRGGVALAGAVTVWSIVGIAGCGGRSDLLLLGGSVDAGLRDATQPTVDASMREAAVDAGVDAYDAPPTPPMCGPSNCTGSHCCQPDGTCVAATTEACGVDGEPCFACPAAYPDCEKPGLGCSAGVPGGCRPETCGGCCPYIPNLSSTECAMGTTDQQCGSGGAFCDACDSGICLPLPGGGGTCGKAQ